MKKRIVIFGGSFDPIHNGHINMALETQRVLGGPNVCCIIFLPNKESVWKIGSSNPCDKIEMIKLAIKDYVNLFVDDFELKQIGPDYTYLSVRYFLNKYEKENIDLYFLLGTDQLDKFHLWKNAEEIASSIRLLHYPRPNCHFNLENFNKYHFETLKDVKMVDASSNEIRNLQDIDVCDSVLEYINDHNLYFLEKVKTYIDEKRFNHSKSVAMLAKKIASQNKIDQSNKYYIAGLLHDIGKNIPKSIISDIENKYSKYMPIDKKLYHQFYSAYIAQHDFNINDESILDAIRFHATGKANMSSIGKAVYAADKVDPLRGYDSKEMICSLMNNLDEGFKFVLKENRAFLILNGKDIANKLTLECFKFYLD